MRYCRGCSFKHDMVCGFWEDLRDRVTLVDCSEEFIRVCCKEEIMIYDPISGIIIDDYDQFLIKWHEMFENGHRRKKRKLLVR